MPPVLRKRAKRSERSARGAVYQENGHAPSVGTISAAKPEALLIPLLGELVITGQNLAGAFANVCYQSMDRQLQHRSRSRDLRRRPKAAIHGRRRPKPAIGQRPRRDRRRPKVGVGACKASLCTGSCSAANSGKKRPLRPALVCFVAYICPRIETLGRSSIKARFMKPGKYSHVTWLGGNKAKY